MARTSNSMSETTHAEVRLHARILVSGCLFSLDLPYMIVCQIILSHHEIAILCCQRIAQAHLVLVTTAVMDTMAAIL